MSASPLDPVIEALGSMARVAYEAEVAQRERIVKDKIMEWLPYGLHWLINHHRLLKAYLWLRQVEVIQLDGSRVIGEDWYRVEIRKRTR